MKKSVKKLLLGVLIFIIVGVIAFIVMIYFYFFPVCHYSEREIKIPEELVEKQLFLENDIYLSRTKTENIKNPSYVESKFTKKCNPNLYNINLTLEYSSWINRGKSFKKGKVFKIEKIIVAKSHGFNFSGNHELVYIILSDEEGLRYKLTIGDLPFDNDEDKDDKSIFLNYYKNGERLFLNWEYFDNLIFE